MKKKMLICALGKTDVRLSIFLLSRTSVFNSNKVILSHEKNVDFKSFVVGVKWISG